jgi:hypothetical protein
VWQKELGELKKVIHLIESQTHDIPASNIVPQPTMLPRTYRKIWYNILSPANLDTHI